MVGPNLLIVGMPRAGTTFMWENLRQHPDIFAPNVKEPHFHLADRWPLGGPEKQAYSEPLKAYLAGKKKHVWGGLITSQDVYSRLYEPGINSPWRLEATPNYFAEGREMALRLSQRLGPDTRIIVMLRDPVARALSHFRLFQKNRWENEELEAAIGLAAERLAQGWAPTWDYLNYSRIEQPLVEWRKVFGDRLMVVAHSDLAYHPYLILGQTLNWLNLAPHEFALSRQLNASEPITSPVGENAEAIVRASGRLDVEKERQALAANTDKSLTPPLVSIGMPVKNGAKSIKDALSSLLSQTYKNIEIVVCDNASTDGTCTIVEDMARLDDRVKIRKFETGVGIQDSYRRALESRRGDYFLFAPCDDSWDPRFIDRAVQYMQRNPDTSVCCGVITMLAEGGKETPSKGTVAIHGSVEKRWTTALLYTADASRLYGLLRNKNLDKIIPVEAPEGWDHYSAAKLALFGDVARINIPAMLRRKTPMRHYLRHIANQEKTISGQILFMRHVVRLFRNDPDFKTSGIKANLVFYHLIFSKAHAPEGSGYGALCSVSQKGAKLLRLIAKAVP